MKPYARKASVLWAGTHQRGKGAISTPNGALALPLCPGDGRVNRRGISPMDLLAAAHAGSFSLTLAGELAEAGYRPTQIDTTATLTVEHLAAGWNVTQIHLDVVAAVPRVAECDFVDAALRAKASCPVSGALTTNISMRAKLNRLNPTPGLKLRQDSGSASRAKGRKRKAAGKGVTK